MQNFPNSPAPPSLPPGFSGRGAGGPTYQPQPLDPQISPRMPEDYSGMQQQQPPSNPQSHSQHPLHRAHPHPSQAGHMLGFPGRNRGAGDPMQGHLHGVGSSNPYRKEAVDYYLTMGGKDRQRRGGMGYGASFGYSNMDGHIPHQYRHAGSGPASSSGMMSPYPLDYGSTGGSGGSSSGVSGAAGAFSPSHQYNMGQNAAMQSVSGSTMQHRQHGQSYPGPQALHHGQQQRTYHHSGHRMTPQYPHYPPQGGASTGSTGMYSPPPHRYHDGANSLPSMNSNSNSVSSSAPANNVGPMENVPQGYHSSSFPGYSPQTHALHKQPTLQHHNSQHNLGVGGYDSSHKMQHHGPPSSSAYSKHQQASNSSIPHQSSQEIAKSPMHSQTQQSQINQNFSPISNPSPAASAVQSPSCSSSPSPLMTVSEGQGNHPGPTSYPHPPNPRSGHGRLLQTIPQLSPTPNSNSSVSSCGSSGSQKAAARSSAVSGRSRMAATAGPGSRDEAYPASPLSKLQDTSLNSINALTSQVANLPNTVQHMLLTDTVLSQKRVKDGGSGQMQPGPPATPSGRPRSRNVSAASSTSTVREGSGLGGGDGASEGGVDEESSDRGMPGVRMEREEQFSEGEQVRMRQMSGASSGSEPTTYYPSSQGDQVKMRSSEQLNRSSRNPQSISETKTPMSSSSQSPALQSAESCSNSHRSHSVAMPSHGPPLYSNSVSEPGAADANSKHNYRKTREIKNEGFQEEGTEKREKGFKREDESREQSGERHIDGQDKENRLSSLHNVHSGEREGKHKTQDFTNTNSNFDLEEQQNASGVGVIVSARSEFQQPEKPNRPQDNCTEDKPLHTVFRESSSHNGEKGVDLSVYSSHHQLNQKTNFGRLQSNPHAATNKCGYPESPYSAGFAVKNRGRPSTGGVMETNTRYQDFPPPQPNYGSLSSKEAGGNSVEVPAKRGGGLGPKGHDDNSQLQQQFPSLLQEVLQGYHLDRRYGRPEQVPPAAQSQNVALANFQTRHPYGISESMRTQSGMGNTPQPSHMVTSGKPFQPNQRQLGVAADFGPQGPIPFIKSEAVGTKGLHNVEKSKMAAAHGPQNTDSFSPTPPKHINLADYSLPQRKPPPPSSQPTSSSSAVQELLLQDSDPLGATESQKSPASFPPQSSGRRSVICDVSPVRRSTPDSETDKEKESHTGSLVIQQKSFSSPPGTNVHMTGNGKDEVGQKHEVKMEVSAKEITPEAGHLHPDHHSTLTAKAEIEYHKSLHQPGVVNVDPYRKGKADMAVMASRHSQQAPRYPLSNTNPMSLPPRHQGYPHNVDLSSAHTSGYSGYRYGDTRERNIMSRNPHFPSHHPYHPLSPTNQLQSSLSANKLTVYPHSRTPHHPHDPMNEWPSALTRPTKDIMMQSGSSPGRNKLGQSEQSQRMLSQVEMLANEQRLSKPQLPHQSAYYDMKMWEATHSGRDGAVMMEGDPYHRTQPHHPAAPPCPVSSQVPPGGLNSLELDASRGALEDVKPPNPLLTSMKVSGEVSSVMPQQGPRPTKTGGSGDTNLLMLRRRVRSFISPIPAKRQHQDGSQVRVLPNSHHSPAALSESSHLNDEDSSSSDITCSRLSSPTPGQNIYSQSLSPSGSKKGLAPRKGRGLKLEAIVQKITPNVRKSPHSVGQVDSESNHYGGFSEMSQFSDSQDQDYMDDSHSLNEMMSYRGMDETVSLPPSAYSCDPLQTSQGLKSGALQADFDFGLGATASSMSDKEDLRIATDFSLLGPLPPPPPLPRPVPGSPPPSCSALSDIQHFTNTYQQLETRRGDQSAANLLRQKLQETAMGFDDYPSADYYGSTPPHHSQGQGHFMNRQMCSGRSSLSMTGSPQDSKGSDSLVPKGYFPSGKKKGRPVGSVNKQKRVQQAQIQNANVNAPTIQPATSPPPAAAAAAADPVPQPIPVTDTITPPLIVFPPADQKPPPSLTPPILTQVKVDVESEDIPLEIEVKPLRRRRRGGVVKAEGDAEGLTGRQRRRRRTAVTIPAKEDFETSVGTGSNTGIGGGFSDSRKNAFAPYVHVERKVPEIGAVCTIVNAEEEKREKGERGAASGLKTSSNGIEALLTSALTSQLSRREKEMERLREKKEAEEVDTSLQTGKVLPLSGYVLSGPVITETNHSGRLLCCLCQKWANYKNLGDLYGPYYPAEYAAKLPKNQPQVRQSPAVTGGSKTGLSLETNSNVANAHETQVHQEAPVIKPSADIDWSLNYPANPGAMVGTASPAGGEEIMMYLAGQLGTTTSTSNTKARNWDTSPDIRPIPELWKQPEPQTETPTYSQPSKQPQVDDAQQRPQHRKLTSHPRFKRRHKSSDKSTRMVPSNSKASLPFQPPPPALDSLGPLAQLAQLPQMPMDPEELWIHEGCIVWASGVFLVNGRLYGLQEALDGAREACCSFCEMAGSTLGCYSKGCTLRYHYLCAMEADCSLNEENFSLRCPQHKVKSFPRAVDLPSQFTWSSQREDEGYSEDEVLQEG